MGKTGQQYFNKIHCTIIIPIQALVLLSELDYVLDKDDTCTGMYLNLLELEAVGKQRCTPRVACRQSKMNDLLSSVTAWDSLLSNDIDIDSSWSSFNTIHLSVAIVPAFLPSFSHYILSHPGFLVSLSLRGSSDNNSITKPKPFLLHPLFLAMHPSFLTLARFLFSLSLK